MSDSAWNPTSPLGRIVAVGDIHADLDALLRILTGTELIDSDGLWIGQGCQLVLLGDLNDRGADSVAVMSYVMELEQHAAGQGDRVVALLGNHELLVVQGEYQYVRAVEVVELDDFWYGHLQGLDAVFRGNGPWARWIRSRPTLVKIGSTAFVHAGLDSRMIGLPVVVINDAVRAWVAYFQGVADEPDESTFWLVDSDEGGPLWSRHLRASCTPPWHADNTRTELRQLLAHLGVDRLVVGHSPTAALDFEIAWPHPVFGSVVAVIDTGISKCYGGRLSALEIVGDRMQPRYFDRGDGELALTSALRGRYEQARRQMASAG